MFRQVSNKVLVIIFLILLLSAAFVFFIDGGKNERTFRDVLVNIDTSAVTEILIYPKSQNHNEVKLFKDKEDWKVSLTGNKTAIVSDKRITDVFNQLLAIKPQRLAAKGEDKWIEFQVDSTGSRVIVKQGDKVVLDLIIGRFSFQQPRSMSTYVRLSNDADVYVVDGFLDMTFNQGANIFRDAAIINDDFNNWNQLQFIYPSDSSFTVSRTGNSWFINGIKTDSLKTANYLTRLSRLTDTKFIDDFSPVNPAAPAYKLSITTKDFHFIEINGYKESDRYVISSSQNPEAYFDGNSAGASIYIGKSALTSK
jgi:hypothetical protein